MGGSTSAMKGREEKEAFINFFSGQIDLENVKNLNK